MLHAPEQWQWLFPVAVTLHNLEEAIWLPGWVAKHANQLPYVAGPAEFRFAAAVLTVAAYVITYLSVHHGRESLWTYLWFGYVVTMLANVFIPHVPATLIFRSYTPGLDRCGGESAGDDFPCDPCVARRVRVGPKSRRDRRCGC